MSDELRKLVTAAPADTVGVVYEQATVPDCEHHWISKHQPDFPSPIYWVLVCSFCGQINAKSLGEEIAPLLVGRDAARGIATQLEQENARLRAVVEAVAKTCGDVIAVEDFGQSRAIPPTRRLLAINLRAAAARGVL